MSGCHMLIVQGDVDRPLTLSFDDLVEFKVEYQVEDVSKLDPSRQGDAVTLAGLLNTAGARPTAKYLGLHSSIDDFHASIPLTPIRNEAFLIYRLHGRPLSSQAGGPFRFYIPRSAACHTDEIDECANVKFVDRIELTAEKGFDNRPSDDQEHEALHRQQEE